MDCRESDSSEESSVPKSATQSVRQLNGDSINEIIVVYEYDEHNSEEYDLAMDGILLNGCSQYLFKFSIIIFPIIFLVVIVIAIFESDERNNEFRRKIGKAFIVLGISVGLLAFYFLCRYGFHIRSLYRESNRNLRSRGDIQNSELGVNKMSKKQLKFILQNPWHRVNDSEPKEQYSNHVDLYVQNGLYNISNNV